MALVQKTLIQACNLVGKPCIITRVVGELSLTWTLGGPLEPLPLVGAASATEPPLPDQVQQSLLFLINYCEAHCTL